MSGCGASPISPLLPPLRSTKCCTLGRASVITHELATSVQPHKPSWRNTEAVFRSRWMLFGICRESAVTPRTPWPRSPSINLSRSSRRTSRVCSLAYSIYKFRLIPATAAKRCGSARVNSCRIGAPASTTRLSWIWARSSADRGPIALSALSEISAARRNLGKLPIKRARPSIRLRTEHHGFFCETGPRLARAIAGSLARDVDAAEIGDSPHETQTAAHFGISVHESSHHVDCVPADGGRTFRKILPALVSYRRA